MVVLLMQSSVCNGVKQIVVADQLQIAYRSVVVYGYIGAQSRKLLWCQLMMLLCSAARLL